MPRFQPALLVLLLAAPALRAQAACDCIDQADIKKRLRLATEAINGYGQELPSVMSKMYSPRERDALQAKVNTYMATHAQIQGLHPNASGATDNLCQIHVKAPTKCLEEAIRRHEVVHQVACEKVRFQAMKKILAGKAADRFEAVGATMMDYIMEEIAGYTEEIKFLQSELMRLQSDCGEPPPPPGRDYSSRGTTGGAPPPGGPPPVPKLKPYGAPPPVKAPPMPKPPPSPYGN